MEEIRLIGTYEPKYAQRMLDSLRPSMDNAPEYVQKRFRLLEVRLQEQMEIMPPSDSIIVDLVEYFEENGSEADKQEANFCAGVAYRELSDAPRAIEHFLHSLSLKEDEPIDSIMRRNTYSNLCYIHYNILDYKNALQYAYKELLLSEQLNDHIENALCHVASSLVRLDSLERAHELFIKIYDAYRVSDSAKLFDMSVLLGNFSFLKDMNRAHDCYSYLHSHYTKEQLNASNAFCLAAGQFFLDTGQPDSARFYYKTVIDSNMEILSVYEALRHICTIDDMNGDLESLRHNARMFIDVCDQLNLGKQQELATTVHNQYLYERSREMERRADERSHRQETLIWILLSVFMVVLICVLAFHFYKRSRTLKLLLHHEEEKRILKEAVRSIDDELQAKIEQNVSFLNIIHQTELEGTADDVIDKVRKASVGQHTMSEKDWKDMFYAVDTLHPEWRDMLVRRIGMLSNSKMKVCYLMRIGLTNTQIVNLTSLSPATVWRYSTKYAPLLDLPVRPSRQVRKKELGD